MAELCLKAGVRPFGLQAIRHSVAMTLEDSGKATLREIQNQPHKKANPKTLELALILLKWRRDRDSNPGWNFRPTLA